MNEIEKRAENSAFEHTVFRALADIYNRLNPSVEIGEYLLQLQRNKQDEKNRILNSFFQGEN